MNEEKMIVEIRRSKCRVHSAKMKLTNVGGYLFDNVITNEFRGKG